MMTELAGMPEEAIWALADEALAHKSRETGDDMLVCEEEAAELFTNNERKVLGGKPIFTLDSRGDVHVCFGMHCPHVTLDRDKNWVCAASGNVVGIECAREQDPSWTGRSTGSANPDDSAGTPVGGWIKKRDMYAASVAAYRSAHAISDAEIAPQPSTKPTNAATPPPAKRGALCVDEEATETLTKRPRSSRKENWTRENLDKLASEAIGVIDKLFIVNVDSRTVEAAATSLAPPPLDARMQSTEFVRPLALRSYVAACASGQQALDMDTLTTVLIHANEYVRSQRELAAEQAKAKARAMAARTAKASKASTACFSGQVRNLLAQLIVSLWRAACLTKHFKTAKKGNDSFRPFAAGILYQLKRGLYLGDGTCVVPVLEELANHLPALRSANSTAAAKQLQSSSHRGICSMQRSIASLKEMSEEDAVPALTLLRDAARQGAFLREMVSRS